MSRRRTTKTESESESDVEYLSKKLGTLKVAKEKRDINILLLGETGVGKSTFINAFFNYLQYPTLKKARKANLISLIPAKFTITDENYEERVISVGQDTNEVVEIGASATQSCRSYVYPIEGGNMKIRLIDTPGIGDTRGISQDNINFENILSFIGEMKQLNAICILLKPNNSRLTVMFEFCIKQLLSRLEKSASRNLIFVFTNTRGTFYRPGETMPALKKLLGTIQGVQIPLDKENVYCTDNEAFRFLAAVSNGIRFSAIDIDNFAQSWLKSVEECWRMITYIIGDSNSNKVALVPHDVKNTISVNEARRLIVQLSQPLADIAQLILDNIRNLERHKMYLNRDQHSMTELKGKLYIPIIDLRVKAMDQPTTVCTSRGCSEVYKIGDKSKWHYRQKCHCPCYLKNVPKEMVGSPELASCAAMNSTGVCKMCSCRFQMHMHIYYETTTYEDHIEDESIKTVIMDKELALIQAQNLIKKISVRIKEYKQESETIIKTTAKFACFLKANAITPYNDAYQAYLTYLIDRERSMGDDTDYEVIGEFQRMLAQYTEEKNVLSNALNHSMASNEQLITADDIIQSVKMLYNLKHNGAKIKELFSVQKRARKDENQSEVKEFVFDSLGNKASSKKKDNVKQSQNKAPQKGNAKQQQNQNQQRSTSQNRRFQRNVRPNQYQSHSSGFANDVRYQPAPIPQPYNVELQTQESNPSQYFRIKQHSGGNFDIQIGQNDSNHPYGHDDPNRSYPPPSYHQNQHYDPNRNRFPGNNPPPYNGPPPPYYPPRPRYAPQSNYYLPTLPQPQPLMSNFGRPRNPNRPHHNVRPQFNPNHRGRNSRGYASEPDHRDRQTRKNEKGSSKKSDKKFHNLDGSSSSSDSDDSKYQSATDNRRK